MNRCVICGAEYPLKRKSKYGTCSEKCRKKYLWENNIKGYKEKGKLRKTKSRHSVNYFYLYNGPKSNKKFEIQEGMFLGEKLKICIHCGRLFTSNSNRNKCLKCSKKINKYKSKEYNNKNKEKVRSYNEKWLNKIGGSHNYRKTNKKVYFSFLLRNRLKNALNYYIKKGIYINSKDKSINYKKVVKYLIRTIPNDFEPGKYHIDHRIPLYEFDLTKKEEIKKAFDPINLQWTLAKYNLKKNKKVIPIIQI